VRKEQRSRTRRPRRGHGAPLEGDGRGVATHGEAPRRRPTDERSFPRSSCAWSPASRSGRGMRCGERARGPAAGRGGRAGASEATPPVAGLTKVLHRDASVRFFADESVGSVVHEGSGGRAAERRARSLGTASGPRLCSSGDGGTARREGARSAAERICLTRCLEKVVRVLR